MSKPFKDGEIYIRNIILGATDSLVSTVGFLAGIGAGGASRQTIILTGVIYAFVEAFSMAASSFLSEESTEEYEVKGVVSDRKPFLAAIVMFISSVVASFVPLTPYIFTELPIALPLSIVLAVVALFLVGIASAKISKVRLLRSGLKMVIIGGMAIVIGVIVAKLIG